MPEEETVDPVIKAKQDAVAGLKKAVADYAKAYLPGVDFDSVEVEQVQPSTVGTDEGEQTSLIAKFQLS